MHARNQRAERLQPWMAFLMVGRGARRSCAIGRRREGCAEERAEYGQKRLAQKKSRERAAAENMQDRNGTASPSKNRGKMNKKGVSK